MGEISDPFAIRQGDGLSPLLFNCVLEKVIQEWRKQKSVLKIDQPITVGRGKLAIDCLAFADDLAILTCDVSKAQKQIELLKESVEEVGFQISFEKTEYMTCNKQAPKLMETKYGKVKRVPQFKYLGETIQENGMETKANEIRCQKMETAYRLTQNIYNKRCISKHTKLSHYNTVIKPECLYGSETLILNRKTDIDNIEKKECRIVRKILGPKLTDGQYRLRGKQEIKQYTNIHSDIRKRRLRFYGHIKRMDSNRLTKQIVEFYENRSKAKTDTMKWIGEIKTDLKMAGITPEDVQNRKIFRSKIHKWQVDREEKPKKKTGTTWSEERKEAHSKRMKEIWAQRKKAKPHL